MAKLSLTARKNIKEHEAKLQENLKKIEVASGILFETEFDWLMISTVAEAIGYPDRAGEIMYSWYLGGLSWYVTKFCQDAIQKESFIETFGAAKRISFEFYDESVGVYVRTRSENGTLMMGAPKANFCSSTDECGRDLSQACSASGGLSVATRKNIKDTEPDRYANIARINKAVGIEFEVDQDWVALANHCTSIGYDDQAGQIINKSYLAGLAGNLEKLCKDEMSKEAVAEACTKKTISFVLAPPGVTGTANCTFIDGVLTATIPLGYFCSRTGELGNDIESRL